MEISAYLGLVCLSLLIYRSPDGPCISSNTTRITHFLQYRATLMNHALGASRAIAASACLRHVTLPSSKAFAAWMHSTTLPHSQRMPTRYLSAFASEKRAVVFGRSRWSSLLTWQTSIQKQDTKRQYVYMFQGSVRFVFWFSAHFSLLVFWSAIGVIRAPADHFAKFLVWPYGFFRRLLIINSLVSSAAMMLHRASFGPMLKTTCIRCRRVFFDCASSLPRVYMHFKYEKSRQSGI